ncbi:MAG: TIGR03617 family F420-dependent LLM class oxidoreductase [Gammaproteobacteria bacterium]
MHIDAFIWDGIDLESLIDSGRRLDQFGYECVWAGEVRHDPFMQLLQIANASSRLRIGTAIAVATARSPVVMASQAWDLQRYSGGRFTLGLGSNVRAQVVDRFSMPWSAPAPRMRDYIAALRAIWANWNDGVPLNHQGPFFRHVAMPPNFRPPPLACGPPPIFLAAVGPAMTRVAAECCDGIHLIGFQSAAYLREVTIPALRAARAAAGRSFEDFTVNTPVVIAEGRTDEELEASIQATRRRVAYYLSVEAYRPMLDHHGWGDLQPEMAALLARGEHAEMARRIPDDVLATYVIAGNPSQIARGLFDRLEGLADRVSFVGATGPVSEVAREILAEVRAERSRRTREASIPAT